LKRFAVFIIVSIIVHCLFLKFLPGISKPQQTKNITNKILVKLEFVNYKTQKATPEIEQPLSQKKKKPVASDEKALREVRKKEKDAQQPKKESVNVINKKTKTVASLKKIEPQSSKELVSKPSNVQKKIVEDRKTENSLDTTDESATDLNNELSKDRAGPNTQGKAQNLRVVSEDMILKKISPLYPVIARRKGMEGEVLLEVDINKDGEVVNVLVNKSSGYKLLDESARLAIKKWLFVPNIEGKVLVPVVFKLK